MMLAWSFSARTPDEVGRLIRSLSRHRYIQEVDIRLSFLIDRALEDRPAFTPHALAFAERLKKEPELDLRSRDPSLHRSATLDEVTAALSLFWSPDEEGQRARDRLSQAVSQLGFELKPHPPFNSPPEEPPHPELVLLDWVLYPVDELDADHHRGALAALEQSGEEINPSEPVYQEASPLSAAELIYGAKNGVLVEDFAVWADGPYPYVDYVFRGAAKTAKLVDPPVGYRDL